jgi:hypothetical protein
VDPIAGGLRGLQRPMMTRPAWQQASSVWAIVGDDDTSGDDNVFTLTSMLSVFLAVQCRDRLVGWSLLVVFFF